MKAVFTKDNPKSRGALKLSTKTKALTAKNAKGREKNKYKNF
ncbi:hypothetical protein FACS1894102_6670 [Spirochaetia bacterium]|nr:hypothetical protein FACS1894102_6670 [Spirochaetia bacterium]